MKSTALAFRTMHSAKHLHSMRLRLLSVALFLLAACGPELNSPASTSVSGKWQTTDPVSFFFDIKMDIVQTPAGDITGGWTAKLSGGHLSCPVNQVCNAGNTVAGRNTVLGINMELRGIGTFTGQLEPDGSLRGDISRFDGDFKVKFTKIP